MRSKVVKTLALALLLCGIDMIAAQQPGSPPGGSKPRPGGATGLPGRPQKQKVPEKSKLEEMLAEALQNNPDIRVAAAKLAEADAELNRTRLQVIQKVVMLHHAILSQKAVVEVTQKKYDRVKDLNQSRAINSQMVDEASAELTAAKAKLEELEAQMPALLGKTPQGNYTGNYTQTLQQARLLHQEGIRSSLQTRRGMIAEAEWKWERIHKATGSIAEKIRKALQTPVKVDYKDMKLGAILDDLAKKVAGASFRLINAKEHKTSMRFEETLPLSAVLQALSDEFDCYFYVREYGILAAFPNSAPSGAMTVEEFLRQKPADESHRPSSGGKNPLEKNVEGLVKNTDSRDGMTLMTLTIGSDAGLAKGHTLELFRINPSSPSKSKYLGTIRILETQAKQSVAQAVGRLADTPKAGDRVASHFLGK